MEIESYNSLSISPAMAQKILAKNGVEVSHEQSKDVLEMLNFLVNLSLDQLIDQEK